MEWQLKKFHELSLNELYSIMKLRQDVFILEQKCLYRDLDDLDQNALHQMARINHQVIAYSRLLISKTLVKIQRVMIDKSYRGQRLGYQLMNQNIAYIQTHPVITSAELNAQTHLQAFYQQWGFTAIGQSFLEDGIPHIKMVRVQI